MLFLFLYEALSASLCVLFRCLLLIPTAEVIFFSGQVGCCHNRCAAYLMQR